MNGFGGERITGERMRSGFQYRVPSTRYSVPNPPPPFRHPVHFFGGAAGASPGFGASTTTAGASAFASAGNTSSLVFGVFFTFASPSRNSSTGSRSSYPGSP